MAQWLVLALALHGAAEGTTFEESFDRARPGLWQCRAGGAAAAAISAGRLALDMSRPKGGKWAFADLHLSIHLPARIEWDQCLTHDSRHTYFAGALLWPGSKGERFGISAGLGGTGLGCIAFLAGERCEGRRTSEGQWYRLVLELERHQQTLSVSPLGSQEKQALLVEWQALVHGPYFLRFFQNDLRLGPNFPDTYDQDRGVTWVDNLRIRAARASAAKPTKPSVTNPHAVPIVFSRAMRWVTREDGLTSGAIAYDAAGWLALTGRSAASRWLELAHWPNLRPGQWPDMGNIRHTSGHKTLFMLPKGKKEAAFALRAFQFNVDQHPGLEWGAEPAGVQWQLQARATDGAHPSLWPLWQSEWSAGEPSGKVDLRAAYRASGRPHRYAEVDLLLRIRAGGEHQGPRQLAFQLGMAGRIAVVPRWPVVSTVRAAQGLGVPIEAILVDSQGQIVHDGEVGLAARVRGRSVGLTPVGSKGLRWGFAVGLPAGEHKVELVATDRSGNAAASTTLTVSVTALDFVSHYERQKRSYCTPEGRAVGPLLGDLFAWLPYASLREPQRQLILGLKQHAQLIEQDKRELGYTKWRSVPRGHIDAYLGYMAACGVRVLRLTPNVSPAEYYLDTGGHLAPHGMEQFAFILSAARRHGLRAVVNLSHYPYLSAATGKRPPVWSYMQAGYPERMKWTSPEMWERLSGYLDELLGFTGQDPAVMAYTVMGENDQKLPQDWINRAYDFIKARAPRQMVVLEQGGSFRYEPRGDPDRHSNYRPAGDGGVGYRAYQTYRFQNDCFMAVAARFFNLAPPGFLGEVSCGINVTPRFVVKYRDAMGIALTLQQPMAIAWSAVMLEAQCRAFTQAARAIDWTSFRRARPPMAVIVDKPDREQVSRLVEYETFLSSLPVDYEYVRPDSDRSPYALVYDSRLADTQNLKRDALPAALWEQVPLRMSGGNHCSYALSQDRRWLAAYVRNAGHYELGLCDIRSVERYRLADRERPIQMALRGFADASRYRLLDASTAQVLAEGRFRRRHRIQLPPTPADLLLLVQPVPLSGPMP